jgi:hypothetical protein
VTDDERIVDALIAIKFKDGIIVDEIEQALRSKDKRGENLARVQHLLFIGYAP